MTTILETERLILREIDIEADLDAWTDMMSDEDTVRHIGGQTLDRAGSWRQMATLIGHQAVRGYGFWACVEKASGKFMGAACVDYCFNTLGWNRVIHVIAEGNIGSIKTAEAIGSKRMYKIDNLPPFGDVQCWAYGQVKT